MPSKSNSKRAPLTNFLIRGFLWSVALLCFFITYQRIERVAAQDNLTAYQYLAEFFQGVDWLTWVFLMMTYSVFFSASTATLSTE